MGKENNNVVHDLERRHIMQWFDNFHKIITYITGIGVVWLVSNVNTNQDNNLIMQGKIDAMNSQLQSALVNRYTTVDAARDSKFINYRIDEVQKQIDAIKRGKK